MLGEIKKKSHEKSIQKRKEKRASIQGIHLKLRRSINTN